MRASAIASSTSRQSTCALAAQHASTLAEDVGWFRDAHMALCRSRGQPARAGQHAQQRNLRAVIREEERSSISTMVIAGQSSRRSRRPHTGAADVATTNLSPVVRWELSSMLPLRSPLVNLQKFTFQAGRDSEHEDIPAPEQKMSPAAGHDLRSAPAAFPNGRG